VVILATTFFIFWLTFACLVVALPLLLPEDVFHHFFDKFVKKLQEEIQQQEQ